MFRIDRSLVKLVSEKNSQSSTDGNWGVGAKGMFPNAATSAEAMVNEYISTAEAEINEKAEEILTRTRDEAARILADAHEEIEEERKRGFNQGFEEGSAESKRLCDEELAIKISENDEALNNILDELYSERERAMLDMEDEVVSLALEIVRKIINPAEDELGTVFTSLIKNALRQISAESKIIIRVGATEYERFFASGATTIELDSGVKVTASVINDLSLEDGECIIDTDDFTINAGVDSQLMLVRLAFERAGTHESD
ncbi:MAG: FliH/SctL family protein [Oscillospiraceae bacterium]|nr:FliH/SctL family protein [Oscillospiraceae bacterium]